MEGKIINGKVGEFTEYLKDNFPDDADIVIDGRIDIKMGSAGVRIKQHPDPFMQLINGEGLEDSEDNKCAIMYTDFDYEEQLQEKENSYEKASIKELIKTLESFPSDCKVMFDNIIVENNNGVLDNRFNVFPVRGACIDYVPFEEGWNCVVYAIPGKDNNLVKD